MERVLQILLQQQGDYISGEKISQQLGISRSAVWKWMKKLQESGYDIEAQKPKGYRLLEDTGSLKPIWLTQTMSESGLNFRFHCLDSVDSTNTEVKRQAILGAEEGLVVTAEEQVQGRGRRGRSFHSPKSTGLYLSLLLRPNCTVEKVSQLTAWVAVAVARAIETVTKLPVEIKWCNDIVCCGKKISGILTELTLESESNFVDFVVVGIGVNVNQQPEDFPEEIQNIASSLYQETGVFVNRNQLCREIISSLNAMYLAFPQDKTEYLQYYRQHCVTLGKAVQLQKGTEIIEGTALDIDEDFQLLFENKQGEVMSLSAGEVSVRGMYGYL